MPESQEPIRVRASKRAAAGMLVHVILVHIGNYAHPLILYDNSMHHYYCM